MIDDPIKEFCPSDVVVIQSVNILINIYEQYIRLTGLQLHPEYNFTLHSDNQSETTV